MLFFCIGGRWIFYLDGWCHRSGSVARWHREPSPVLPTVRLRPSVLRAHVCTQSGPKLRGRLRPTRLPGRPQVISGRTAGGRSQGRRSNLQPGVRNRSGHMDPRVRGTRVSRKTKYVVRPRLAVTRSRYAKVLSYERRGHDCLKIQVRTYTMQSNSNKCIGARIKSSPKIVK